MTLHIYGIKNCDTMKKARAWLAAQGLEATFHDYKVEGVDETRLRGWADVVAWKTLLNTAGTTFRKLPEADRADVDAEKAIALMLAQPSMIKRPVLEYDGGLLVGFKAEVWAEKLG